MPHRKSSLSPRQQQILDFIRQEVERRGYPPSVREIGQAVGLKSSATVHGHLNRLEAKGFLRRDPTKPRAIELLGPEARPATVNVPVVGRVTAGEPILAVENIEQRLPLPTEFFGRDDELFALRVRGDSMVGAGILDGDMVIVARQSAADDGDIVVALLDDEATVKRFYKEGDRVRLQAENPRYEPIYAQEVRILGKVIGLLRRF
ncbi:MAG: transcriptional repressor LexA [Limnochordales bacterium]|nr:transcriptional repressor LexA [Limnochordales bacterium]